MLLLLLFTISWLLAWILVYKQDSEAFTWRLLIVHSSIVCAIVLIEIASLALKIDYRLLLGTLGDEPWYHPSNKLDSELLHLHKPNQKLVGVQKGGDISYYFEAPSQKEYTYDLSIDQEGFRNNRFPEQSDVVILGDSFVEGIVIPQRSLVTSVLERKLDLQVSNLSQIWYGPQQELAVLKRYAPALKPQLIVWVYFAGNDISDYRRYQVIKSNWAEIKAKHRSKLRRSFSWNAVKKLYSSLSTRTKPEALEIKCPRGSLTENYYVNYQPFEDNQENQETLSNVLNIIQTAINASNQLNAHFMFVYAPTKLEVIETICSQQKRERPIQRKLLTAVNNLQGDFVIVNLTNSLIEASTLKPVYFSDDTHWNEFGHHIVADTIYKAIEANELVKSE